MNIIDYLTKFIEDCNRGAQKKSIMLTGGRSAKFLYKSFHNLNKNKEIKNIDFFLTDERHVLPESHESNQRLVEENFISGLNLSRKSHFYTFDTNKDNHESICNSYESLLPQSIDLMILSMGEDGHIASLFPHSDALHENRKNILSTFCPKPPPSRFTITPKVIKNTKEIFILCFGEEKRKKFEEARKNPDDFYSIPARLVLNRNWVFDINEDLNLKK